MLKIRLSRHGKKRKPSYRVVVADAEAPRDGRYVESIGFYDPLTEPVDLQNTMKTVRCIGSVSVRSHQMLCDVCWSSKARPSVWRVSMLVSRLMR